MVSQAVPGAINASVQVSGLYVNFQLDWLDHHVEEIIAPEQPIIDAHHHLWERPGSRYLLDDLLADIRSGHDVRATIYVEARSRYRTDGPEDMRPVGEVEAIDAAAASCVDGMPKIGAGIVGFAGLHAGPSVRAVLAAMMAASPERFRGIRQVSAWDADDGVTSKIPGRNVSLLAALVILRGRGAARLVTDYVVNVPVAVPAILFGMGIFVAYGLGPVTRFLNRWLHINLYGSAALIVFAYTVLTLPHVTRLIMSGLAQLNPQLESAARVFGSRPSGVVLRVLVPLLRRNFVSAAMLALILSSHEFAASVLLVGPDTQVMATALYNQWDTGTYPHVAALALIMVAIAIVCVTIVALTDLSGRHRSIPGGA